MLRYCNNCQKEYDFKIRSVKDLENLVCPICGNRIDKDSKKPVDRSQSDRTEKAIGKAYSGIIHFAFVVFLLFETFGLVAFLLKWNTALYIATVISLIAYAVIYGWLNVIVAVLGAVIGFLIFGSFSGFCLGMLVTTFLRRVFTAILFRFVRALARRG